MGGGASKHKREVEAKYETKSIESSLDIASILLGVQCFHEFSPEVIERLAAVAVIVDFQPRVPIVRQGAAASFFGVLASGTIDVSVTTFEQESQLGTETEG